MAFSLTHLCTTYNYARFLPGHLESVRAQTRRPEQVVVSDDCSPRDTPEVVRAACAGYPEAEVRIQPTNLGSARHVFDLCNAVQTDAYIAMSADDLVADPNFYQDALRILEEDPSVVAVYGLFQHMNEQGRSTSGAMPPIDSVEPMTRFSGQEMRDLMALENVIPSVCVVVRTHRSSAIPAYPILNEYCTDWIHYYLLTLSGDFVRLNRVICHYRIQAQGLYMQHLNSPLARQRKDQGYEALLARPELSDHDRELLRAGRARDWFSHALIGDKPAALLRHWREPAAWFGALETMLGLVSQRTRQLQQRLKEQSRRRFFSNRSNDR